MAWIALARLGVVEVPVSTSLRGDLLAHQFRTAGCELVITTAEWAARFEEIAAGCRRCAPWSPSTAPPPSVG